MVIYHPNGLHEGIQRGRTDKVEARFFQRFGTSHGLGRPTREIRQHLEIVHLRLTADEAPDPLHWLTELLPSPRILANCKNFPPVADDPGVENQSFQLSIAHGRDPRRLEMMKNLAVVVAFLQDRPP